MAWDDSDEEDIEIKGNWDDEEEEEEPVKVAEVVAKVATLNISILILSISN